MSLRGSNKRLKAAEASWAEAEARAAAHAGVEEALRYQLSHLQNAVKVCSSSPPPVQGLLTTPNPRSKSMSTTHALALLGTAWLTATGWYETSGVQHPVPDRSAVASPL